MKLKLIEPLRELFKDEVRELGKINLDTYDADKIMTLSLCTQIFDNRRGTGY